MYNRELLNLLCNIRLSTEGLVRQGIIVLQISPSLSHTFQPLFFAVSVARLKNQHPLGIILLCNLFKKEQELLQGLQRSKAHSNISPKATPELTGTQKSLSTSACQIQDEKLFADRSHVHLSNRPSKCDFSFLSCFLKQRADQWAIKDQTKRYLHSWRISFTTCCF